MSVQVKICGLCSHADARSAAEEGADYCGVILAPGYRRSQSLDAAHDIFGDLAVHRVGVFVDEDVEVIADAIDRLRLDVVQLHGDENAMTIAAIRRSAPRIAIWKAVRVQDAARIGEVVAAWDALVDAVLLDGWSADARGGAGITFDWRTAAAALPHARRTRIVAAGGLTPANVGDAIERLTPDVVDVSSGVEADGAGKSRTLIREFIAAARSVRGPIEMG